MLHPGRGSEIQIPFHLLHSHRMGQAIGLGGTWRYFSESCVLSFEDDRPSYVRRHLDIFIAEPGWPAEYQERPSILGRDFLNLCDVRLNHAQNLVTLDPLNVESGFILSP